jgi:hypothetical protein
MQNPKLKMEKQNNTWETTTEKLMGLKGVNKLLVRSLLRGAVQLNKQNKMLWFQRHPRVEQYGTAEYFATALGLTKTINSYFPQHYFLSAEIKEQEISGEKLQRLVRKACHVGTLTGNPISSQEGMHYLKVFNEQVCNVFHYKEKCVQFIPISCVYFSTVAIGSFAKEY